MGPHQLVHLTDRKCRYATFDIMFVVVLKWQTWVSATREQLHYKLFNATRHEALYSEDFGLLKHEISWACQPPKAFGKFTVQIVGCRVGSRCVSNALNMNFDCIFIQRQQTSDLRIFQKKKLQLFSTCKSVILSNSHTDVDVIHSLHLVVLVLWNLTKTLGTLNIKALKPIKAY